MYQRKVAIEKYKYLKVDSHHFASDARDPWRGFVTARDDKKRIFIYLCRKVVRSVPALDAARHKLREQMAPRWPFDGGRPALSRPSIRGSTVRLIECNV